MEGGMADSDLSAALVLRRGAMSRIGHERIVLVEAIAREGSISAAAKAVGLSYKGAWDAVQALNNLFDGPLIAATTGGKGGGEASVTPRGLAVVAAFRKVEAGIGEALARLEENLAAEGLGDTFWSLGMRTSARNALRGVVTEITPGAVNSEVALSLGDGVEIVAILTRRSIEDLGLAVGVAAIALIKSSFVILAKGEGLRTSARNQIAGIVRSREDGAVNSEIVLDIGGGKTVTATITRDSADNLAIVVGEAVTALIKAPHVILAVE
jgi:molybdate transport system regulatory protein